MQPGGRGRSRGGRGLRLWLPAPRRHGALGDVRYGVQGDVAAFERREGKGGVRIVVLVLVVGPVALIMVLRVAVRRPRGARGPVPRIPPASAPPAPAPPVAPAPTPTPALRPRGALLLPWVVVPRRRVRVSLLVSMPHGRLPHDLRPLGRAVVLVLVILQRGRKPAEAHLLLRRRRLLRLLRALLPPQARVSRSGGLAAEGDAPRNAGRGSRPLRGRLPCLALVP